MRTKEEIFEELKKYFIVVMHLASDVHLSSYLWDDLGIDSLEKLVIIMDMETHYRIQVTDAESLNVETVQDIVNLIALYLEKDTIGV